MTGVFVDRRSVCAGYSEAFCFLLRSIGIPCGCITGHVNNGTNDRGLHQWNVAIIDGVATLIDPTWGDPVYLATDGRRLPEDISYRYLCVTEGELRRTHDPDVNQTIPSCESQRYDWFLRRNLLLDAFSTYEMDSLLCKAVAQGEKSLEVKFTSRYDYDQAVEYIDSSEIFSGRFGEKLRLGARKSRRVSISHGCDSNLQIVRVSW
ncbi:MAG: hypothetical protein IKE22_01045 [Atopobiaceae bacterium]|nr:hypothetical protein [Atopobiaceae bacterium]